MYVPGRGTIRTQAGLLRDAADEIDRARIERRMQLWTAKTMTPRALTLAQRHSYEALVNALGVLARSVLT